MKSATTKLLAACFCALTLLAFTSCNVEQIPGFDTAFEKVTGSSSTSMVSNLTATSQATGSFTEDFKNGFNAGYEAGRIEAAKLANAGGCPPGCGCETTTGTCAPGCKCETSGGGNTSIDANGDITFSKGSSNTSAAPRCVGGI